MPFGAHNFQGPIATPPVLNAYLCIVKLNDSCTHKMRFSGRFYAKMRLRPELPSGPSWGSWQRSPSPVAGGEGARCPFSKKTSLSAFGLDFWQFEPQGPTPISPRNLSLPIPLPCIFFSTLKRSVIAFCTYWSSLLHSGTKNIQFHRLMLFRLNIFSCHFLVFTYTTFYLAALLCRINLTKKAYR